MSEYTNRLGQRVELRQQRQRLASEIEALRDRQRELLDPVADVDQLPGDEIARLALTMAERLIALGEVNAKLEKLRQILGS